MRAARLLTAFALVAFVSPAVAQKLEPKPAMLHPDDLFVGPADAELEAEVTQSGQRVKVRLAVRVRLLTKGMVVYQAYRTENGKEVLDDAVSKADGLPTAGTRVTAVSVKEPKNTWKWDDAAKGFAGKVVPPDPPVAGSAKLTDKQLRGYLIGCAERLHLGLENALQARDEEAVKGWLAYMDPLRDLATARKLPDEVQVLFRLRPYLKEQKERLSKLEAGLKKLAEVKVDAAKQAEAIRAEAEAEAGFATMKGLLGGFAYFGSDDSVVQQAGVELAASAADDLVAAGLRRTRRELAVKQAEAMYEAKAVKAIRDLRREYDAAHAELVKKRAAAWRGVGMDPPSVGRLDDLAVRLLRSKDASAAAEVLEARHEYLTKHDVFDPGAYTVGVRLRAVVLLQPPPTEDKRRENAETVMALAREVVAATGKVPGGAAFARDRAELLGTAADLVHKAVCYSIDPAHKGNGPRRWSEAFDPRADYGVRVADLALGEVGEAGDRGAGLRATRAWLLFQRGLFVPAFEQGQKVEKVRELDPYTQANLARVYAQQGKTTEATARFVQAVKVGFTDLAGVERDGDFFRVRTAKGKELVWSDYAKPNLNVVMTVADVGQPGVKAYSFEVKNTGTLPLVNAVLTCGDNPKKPLARMVIPALPPGQSVFWPAAFQANPKNVQNDDFRVSNDGKPEVTVTNIQSGPFSGYAWRWWWLY